MTTLSTPINDTTAPVQPAANPNLILLITITAASFAAISIRFALNAGMNPILIAAGRLALAALAYTPLVWFWHRPALANMSRRTIVYSVAAGVFLGLHFIAIALSLQKTSVLINQVFTNMGPICVALLEMVLLKVKQPRAVWFGIAVSIAGGMIITLGNPGGLQNESGVLLGSAIAMLGCVMASMYMVIGRRVRAEVSFVPYVWIVFGSGALTALTAALIAGVPFTGYSTNAYLWVLVIALIPQLVGHSGYNYLVGYFSATFISLVNLTIIVTSALLAFLLFREVPSMAHFIGGTVIVAGVVLAVVGQKGGGSLRLWLEKRKR